MTSEPKTKRVRWKVRACPEGWLPIVLIGEVPIVGVPYGQRRQARDAAKAKAKAVRGER